MNRARLSRRLLALATLAVALAGGLAAPLAGDQLGLGALLTALLVGAGAEAQARLHPHFGPLDGRRLAGFWIGPALTALAAVLAAGLLQAEPGRVVPFVGALMVGALLFAQDRELEEHDDSPKAGWSGLASALILYLVAFVLFVVLYGGRELPFLSALAIGVSGALLAVALFRPSGAEPRRVWLLAMLTGLCAAEIALVLGAWITVGLLGGAFLLLYFYVTAGLIQALLAGGLDRRLAIEYGLVGLIGLVLIISATPWRT